jgi:hypothetical protein
LPSATAASDAATAACIQCRGGFVAAEREVEQDAGGHVARRHLRRRSANLPFLEMRKRLAGVRYALPEASLTFLRVERIEQVRFSSARGGTALRHAADGALTVGEDDRTSGRPLAQRVMADPQPFDLRQALTPHWTR